MPADPVLIKCVYKVEWKHAFDGGEMAEKLRVKNYPFSALGNDNEDSEDEESSEDETETVISEMNQLQIAEQRHENFAYNVQVGEMKCLLLSQNAVVFSGGNQETLIHEIFSNLVGPHQLTIVNKIHKARLGYEPKLFLEPKNVPFVKNLRYDKTWWDVEFNGEKGAIRIFRNGNVILTGIMNQTDVNAAWGAVKDHVYNYNAL